jgi:Hint domain
MKTFYLWALCIAFLLSGCSPAQPNLGVSTAEVRTVVAVTIVPGNEAGTRLPFPSPGPATAIPTLSAGLSLSELKYRLLGQFPNLFFCDPDYYPVARADEGALANERFPQLQADTGEFQAILIHNGLSGLTSFTDAQKLLIYREHKRLAAIQFVPAADKYQFQLKIADATTRQGFIIKGSIDGSGSIVVQSQQPSFATCPICLAANTQISTPKGPKAVEELTVGDPVWTADTAGERIPGTILKVVQVIVPTDHQMVHIVLEDGRELTASPGHPTTDGRTLADLRPGDMLDGSPILHLELIPYDQPATYDLLPSGATGFYWADGILIGSTLAHK